MLVRGVLDATVVEVTVKASLVNGIHWAKTHGHSWEFPEILHAMWVWVRRDTTLLTGYFLTEAVKIILRESAFHKRTSVHTW